jgi:hypothetical protein
MHPSLLAPITAMLHNGITPKFALTYRSIDDGLHWRAFKSSLHSLLISELFVDFFDIIVAFAWPYLNIYFEIGWHSSMKLDFDHKPQKSSINTIWEWRVVEDINSMSFLVKSYEVFSYNIQLL